MAGVTGLNSVTKDQCEGGHQQKKKKRWEKLNTIEENHFEIPEIYFGWGGGGGVIFGGVGRLPTRGKGM